MPLGDAPVTLVDNYVPAGTIPLVWDGAPVTTYKYVPGGSPALTALPNVQPIACTQREGPDPGTALFRYDLTNPSSSAPHTPEETITTAKPWVVKAGDQLVIKATQPGGAQECIFHGRALAIRLALNAGERTVQITATGIAKDAWDTPLPGALTRDGDAPATVSDVQTDVVAQFNPKGEPNATPSGADAGPPPMGGDDKQYPTFLDPLIVRTPDVRRPWTLAMAARYILYTANNATTIANPEGADLDLLLVSKEPFGDAPFDPDDVATYNAKDIIVPDTPITGRDWPTALYDLIRDYGFGMKWTLTTDGSGNPATALTLFQQQSGGQKPILMQAAGADLDRSLTNCESAEVTRDLRDLVNEWWVEGAPKRYEASFVLQCGFPMATTDGASVSALQAFDKSSPAYAAANHDAYRLYMFDETGEGHYAVGASTPIDTAPSLDALLGAGNYAKRRRKPTGELLKLDAAGKPLKWRVAISKDYANAAPAIWDGTGTWQPVQGGVELLKDRLGVRITASNPNRWKIGESKETGAPFPLGVVKGVEIQAGGTASFALRLTCVIEGDQVVTGKGVKRTASPLPYTVVRKVDARDRYRLDTRAAHSEFNTTGSPVVVRDDTDDATAEATAARYTTEAGELDGRFVIDHLTTAYDIGDRIQKIQGRETPLRTDAGLTGENPVLPVIIERRFEFFPEQRTYLTTSDAGTERGRFKRATNRGKAHAGA